MITVMNEESMITVFHVACSTHATKVSARIKCQVRMPDTGTFQINGSDALAVPLRCHLPNDGTAQ